MAAAMLFAFTCLSSWACAPPSSSLHLSPRSPCKMENKQAIYRVTVTLCGKACRRLPPPFLVPQFFSAALYSCLDRWIGQWRQGGGTDSNHTYGDGGGGGGWLPFPLSGRSFRWCVHVVVVCFFSSRLPTSNMSLRLTCFWRRLSFFVSTHYFI